MAEARCVIRDAQPRTRRMFVPAWLAFSVPSPHSLPAALHLRCSDLFVRRPTENLKSGLYAVQVFGTTAVQETVDDDE